MAGTPTLPAIPPVLKPLQHHLKTATEHDQRDPVIGYWCRLHALQTGLKIDRKSKESLTLLTAIMEWLEKFKQAHKENEAVTNDVVAQAHIENYAIKLFLYADSEDRMARFNKNVVKAFYTAGLLFDVLTEFGELTEENAHHRKYAKWKAAYIHNCLKNGETPVPGPAGEEDETAENEFGTGIGEGRTNENFQRPQDLGFGGSQPPYPSNFGGFLPQPPVGSGTIPPHPSPSPSRPGNPSSLGEQHPQMWNSGATEPTSDKPGPLAASGVELSCDAVAKAQKYCKFAQSALNYEDVPTAVENLQKALHLLQTGQDS